MAAQNLTGSHQMAGNKLAPWKTVYLRCIRMTEYSMTY
mgnify:CR=1 FL=1|jgi:hypothetical protein